MPATGPWTTAALWHGLRPEPAPRPTTPIEPELATLHAQKLTPLLLRYLRDTDASVPPGPLRTLQASEFGWTARTATVLQHAGAALATLEAAGIASVVSKGPGIAAHYPALRDRPFSDVDVLVARSDFADAVRRLQALGYSEDTESRQPRAWFDRWCREGLNLKTPAGGSIDLHHHLPPWRWSTGVPTDRLVARSADEGIEVRGLRCLSAADNLLVAALHVVSDRNRPGRSLLVWRDVAQLASAVDPAVAAERADEAGLRTWLRAVLQALPEAVRPDRLLEALTGPDDLQAAGRLRLLLAPTDEPRSVVVTQVLRLPVLAGAGYLAGTALPSRRFLREKFGSDQRLYRRWWTQRRWDTAP